MTIGKEDPELYESDQGTGDESAYDAELISNTPFDPEQFELPEDYEFDGDDDD